MIIKYHKSKFPTFCVVILLSLNLLNSCAKKNYSSSERKTNNSFSIITNLPNTTVQVKSKGLREKENLSPTNQQIQGDKFVRTYTYDKLKFRRTFLVVEGDNYETEEVKIWRSPRWKVVGKDLLLSMITYGVPFLIDPFRSDFYRIASWSKTVKVEMKYSQTFMEQQLERIKNATDPEIFADYIKRYPYSNVASKAIDLKDSCELVIAINAYSETAIEKYIALHQSSKFLKEAEEIKAGMVEAREQFEMAKTTNTEHAYKSYLLNYPKSVYKNKVINLLFEIAFVNALKANKSANLLSFNKEIFIPYQSFISADTISKRLSVLEERLDHLIIKENDIDPKNKYSSFSNVWKKYQLVLGENPNFSNLDLCASYKSKIADLLIVEISKLATESKQTDFLTKAALDFPQYCEVNVGEDVQPSLIKSIIVNNEKYIGTLKLYNQGFIQNHLSTTWEGDPLKNFVGFNYKGIEYSNFRNSTYEEVTLKNGVINEVKLFNQKTPLCSYTILPNGFTQIDYYNDGKLVRSDFYDSKVRYHYEFENGVNLSFRDLENRIKKADAELANKNYDLAIDMYLKDCKNDYPKSIPLNIRIQNSVENAKAQKSDYLLKLEQQRIAEEKRQEQMRIAEEKRIEQQRLAEESKVYEFSEADFSDNASQYIGKMIVVPAFYSSAGNAGAYSDVSNMTLRSKGDLFEDIYSVSAYYYTLSDGAENNYRRRVMIDGRKVNLIIPKSISGSMPNTGAANVWIKGKIVNYNTIEVRKIVRQE